MFKSLANLARLYCCDPASLIGAINDQAETLPDTISVVLNHADMTELDRAEVLRFYHFLTHAPKYEE